MAVGVLAVRLCCVKIRADSDLLAVQPRKTTNYQSRDSLLYPSLFLSLFSQSQNNKQKRRRRRRKNLFFFFLPLTLKKSDPIAVVGVCIVVVVVFCFFLLLFLLFQLFRSLVLYDDDHLATADHQNYRVSSLFSPSSSSSI